MPVLSGFNALVDEGLDSVPCLAADKCIMPACIRHSVPIEIAGIDPLSQDLVQRARRYAAAPDGPALRFALCDKRLQRILPRHEFIKQLRDGRSVVVGNDYAAFVRALNIAIAHWCVTGVKAASGLLQHALVSLLAEILRKVTGHEHTDAVHELIR